MARKNLHGRMKILRLSSNSVHGWMCFRLPNVLPAITVSSGRSSNEWAQPIGIHDMMIGGHARSEGLAVVTNNVREFQRMPGLRVENWLEP